MSEREARKEARRAGTISEKEDAQKASFSEFQKTEDISVHGGICSEFWGESETWNERPPKGTGLERSADHRNKGSG